MREVDRCRGDRPGRCAGSAIADRRPEAGCQGCNERLGAALDSRPPAAGWGHMSQHTSRTGRHNPHRSNLPRGRAKLVALELAIGLAGAVHQLSLPRGNSHLRDHLARAADNTALRLTEAGGRTMGNRRQHLEAAFAENQEVQSALLLLQARGITVPADLLRQADRLGGMVYGLLRAEAGRAG